MPHLDDEVLARALAVISKGASLGDTIVDPFTPLEREGIPKEAVLQLVHRRCLTGRGRLQFRIDRVTLPLPKGSGPDPARATGATGSAAPPQLVLADVPFDYDAAIAASGAAPTEPAPPPAPTPTATAPALPRPPRFLLVVDVENVARTCQDLHAPFRPNVIREVANRCGEVAFAFALGNLLAINKRDRELLTIAGFPLLHCERLPDGNGGKDTVDENAQDLIRRFLDHGAVDGVILATDDRNFIPIMVGVRDRGRQLIRIAVRTGTELDRVGDVRHLPLHDEDPIDPGVATPSRPWVPQIVIDDLQVLIGISSQAERERAIRNMNLKAPFVCRLLRAFLQRWWNSKGPHWLTSFPVLLDEFRTAVLPDDRANVSDDDLRAFLTALIDIGVVERVENQKDGRQRRGYRPCWTHPFFVHAISDIQERGPRFRRRDDRRDRPGANGSAGSSDDHASAAVQPASTPGENPR